MIHIGTGLLSAYVTQGIVVVAGVVLISERFGWRTAIGIGLLVWAMV